MAHRISFDISDDAFNALVGKSDGVPVNALIKETIYKLVGVEVELDGATRRRLESLALRKARIEAAEQELAQAKEVRRSLV
jgi:hypothetical protein